MGFFKSLFYLVISLFGQHEECGLVVLMRRGRAFCGDGRALTRQNTLLRKSVRPSAFPPRGICRSWRVIGGMIAHPAAQDKREF
jgi:hypothetical protein